jgi:hypothetical protein
MRYRSFPVGPNATEEGTIDDGIPRFFHFFSSAPVFSFLHSFIFSFFFVPLQGKKTEIMLEELKQRILTEGRPRDNAIELA